MSVHNVAKDILDPRESKKQGVIPQDPYSQDTHHPVDTDKVLWLLGPGGQPHVARHWPLLPLAQVVSIAVDEHFREVVELRDELLLKTRKSHHKGLTNLLTKHHSSSSF